MTAESDHETLEAVLVTSGVVTLKRTAKAAGSQRVFLGHELGIAESMAYEAPHTDKQLHSRLRSLYQVSRSASGLSARVEIGGQPAVTLPEPVLEAFRSAVIGRHETRIWIHAAFWAADAVTAHRQCASIEVHNWDKTVGLIEPRLLCALTEGLSTGKAGLLLRLGDQARGEWAQAKPTWPQTYELSVLARLSSKDGLADGGDLHARTWMQKVASTAKRVSSALAVQMAEHRVDERQQTRNQRIQDSVAKQCGDLVDEWLTDAGDGEFRARAIATIVALRQEGEDEEDDTVRDWIRRRICAAIANEP